MTFTLPKSVQIGPFKYSVGPIPPQVAGEIDYDGQCNRSANTIRVATHMAPARIAEVLNHEIFHALFEVAGLLHVCPRDEEQIVNSLSLAWAQFARDNPALVKQLVTAFTKA